MCFLEKDSQQSSTTDGTNLHSRELASLFIQPFIVTMEAQQKEKKKNDGGSANNTNINNYYCSKTSSRNTSILLPASLYDFSAPPVEGKGGGENNDHIIAEEVSTKLPEAMAVRIFENDKNDGEVKEEDEFDDAVMETIMEDSSMDFVWVSSETPTTSSCEMIEEEDESSQHQNCQSSRTHQSAIATQASVSQGEPSSVTTFVSLGTSFLSQIWNYARDSCTTSSRQQQPRRSSSLLSSSPSQHHYLPRQSRIHQSYDWVSNVRIDGGQLILPGPLIVLDENNMCNNNDPNNSNKDIMLSNSTSGIISSTLFDDSLSNTIMVSAHDLLATTNSNDDDTYGDNNEFVYHSTIASSSSSFSKALWKFVKISSKNGIRKVQKPLIATASYVSKKIQRIEQKYHIVSKTMGWVSTSLGTILGDDDNDNKNTDDDHNNDNDPTTVGSQNTIIELTTIEPTPTELTTITTKPEITIANKTVNYN